MEALYDQRGRVHAWLDFDRDNILDLRGKHLAFIADDSVYNWRGQHIGWWIDGCVRDPSNAAAYFIADAGSIGVVKPVKAVRPVQPVKAVPPVRPVKQVKPVKPVKKLTWSANPPF